MLVVLISPMHTGPSLSSQQAILDHTHSLSPSPSPVSLSVDEHSLSIQSMVLSTQAKELIATRTIPVMLYVFILCSFG
jgi:hypothetical protein